MIKKVIALAMALACSSAVQAADIPKEAVETIVALEVNSSPRLENIDVMQMPDGDVWLSVETWKELNVTLPDDAAGSVSAKSLGVEAKFNTVSQSINLIVPKALLPMQQLRKHTARVEATDPQPKGVLINYDLSGTVNQAGNWGVSAGHDVRTGLAGGVLRTTGQLNASSKGTEYVRGLTTWQRDRLKSGTTVQVGDVFTGSTTLTPTVNLGGVRFATDRGLSGGEPTWPVPLLGGVAETRSTADLYVNQTRTGQHTVAPGPYQLDHYPVVNGRNEVQLILKDDFGREQVVSRSFYHSPKSLKKGTTEFDISAGLLRKGSSQTYQAPAIAAKVERGMTDNWTTGLAIQATKESRNLTATNRLTLGSRGALNLDVSTSTSNDAKGSAWAASYEYNTRDWSVRASKSRYSDDYWSLSHELSDETAAASSQLKDTASLSASFSPRGRNYSLAGSYVAINYQNGRKVERVGLEGRYRKNAHSISAGASYDLVSKDPRLALAYRYDFGNSLVDVRWRAGGS